MPSAEQLVRFLEANKTYLAGLTALNSVVNLILIICGLIVLAAKWKELKLVAVGPLQFEREKINFELEQYQKLGEGRSATASRKGIEQAVRRATEPSAANRLAGKTILWVDDHPGNNRLAIKALSRLRLHIESALSTEDALAHLERYPDVDLIISDMGRGENLTAGYELLGQVRKRGIQSPFAIFAGSDNPGFRKEAARRGAQLSTNDVGELLNFITVTLGK